MRKKATTPAICTRDVLASTQRTPPAAMLLFSVDVISVSSRNPPNIVLQSESVALQANMRWSDNSHSTDWCDDLSQNILVFFFSIFYTMSKRPISYYSTCSYTSRMLSRVHHEDFSIHHDWNFPWSTCQRVCFVSTYLIWFLRSQLIRPNNQSRTTPWVLETCLIVGLRPLTIILITAFLFSNTYNKTSWRNKINIVQIIAHSVRLLSFFELGEVLNELHVCSITSLPIRYNTVRVFQELRRSNPINHISGRFESTLLTILPRISSLLLWNDGHQCME